jgi:hypothetical protein
MLYQCDGEFSRQNKLCIRKVLNANIPWLESKKQKKLSFFEWGWQNAFGQIRTGDLSRVRRTD